METVTPGHDPSHVVSPLDGSLEGGAGDALAAAQERRRRVGQVLEVGIDQAAAGGAASATQAMSLKDQLTADMKTAMKGGDKERLNVIRLILADIKRAEVDGRKELDDAALLGVLEKAVKQRRDSVEQFSRGGRQDLATKEQSEIDILEKYLPAQLTESELDALIDEVIAATGAESIRDMGKVMAAIKSQAAGKADMGAVSGRVKARLGA